MVLVHGNFKSSHRPWQYRTGHFQLFQCCDETNTLLVYSHNTMKKLAISIVKLLKLEALIIVLGHSLTGQWLSQWYIADQCNLVIASIAHTEGLTTPCGLYVRLARKEVLPIFSANAKVINPLLLHITFISDTFFVLFGINERQIWMAHPFKHLLFW